MSSWGGDSQTGHDGRLRAGRLGGGGAQPNSQVPFLSERLSDPARMQLPLPRVQGAKGRGNLHRDHRLQNIFFLEVSM